MENAGYDEPAFHTPFLTATADRGLATKGCDNYSSSREARSAQFRLEDGMKVLLIVSGVLFLLLAFALFVGAIVIFFVARKRKRMVPADVAAAPGASLEPGRQARVERPVHQPQSAVGEPAKPAAFTPDANSTVVIDTRRPQPKGALRAISGTLAGQTFPIDTKGFYIGRDRSVSEVVIESPSVSKRHVWIGVRDGEVFAIDQKSTNGTFLNAPGSPIDQTRLSPGDTLIISDDVARFTFDA